MCKTPTTPGKSMFVSKAVKFTFRAFQKNHGLLAIVYSEHQTLNQKQFAENLSYQKKSVSLSSKLLKGILFPSVKAPASSNIQMGVFWLTGRRGLTNNYPTPCWPAIWPSLCWFPASSNYPASCTAPGSQGPAFPAQDAGVTALKHTCCRQILQVNFHRQRNCSKLHWLSMGSHWQTPGDSHLQMSV